MNIIDHITLDGVTKYIKDSAGQAMIAPEETSTTAAHAYAVGEVFRYDGKLYKATTAITIGDTITPNTNCAETSIGEGFPHDVQINGTSILSNGVASIPIGTSDTLGVLRVKTQQFMVSNGLIENRYATEADAKEGLNTQRPVNIVLSNAYTFYGLARAAGDTTQAQSNNAVGTYTTTAATAIKTMLQVQEGLEVVRLI